MFKRQRHNMMRKHMSDHEDTLYRLTSQFIISKAYLGWPFSSPHYSY
jgi:hypothetical protein